MKNVLCFGDSNTHGTQPMRDRDDTRRFDHRERWPGVMRAALGDGWFVIEEGLPGRTIARDDPLEGADRNALRYLPACLQTHRPLAVVVFMLGTNDLKARFGVSAGQIAEGAHALIDCVIENALPGNDLPRVLLVSPMPIAEAGVLSDMFSGGAVKSRQIGPRLRAIAAQRQVGFLDAGEHVSVSAEEGIHLDRSAHLLLGAVLADAVRALAR